MQKSLLAIFLLISGCTGPSSEEATNGSPSPVFDTWDLNDCFGFELATLHPLDTGSGNGPPGWDFDLTQGRIASQTNLLGLSCKRVSIFGAELADVKMVWEFHSKFTAPAACEVGKMDFMWIMSKVLADNDLLVTLLHANGVPSALAAVEVESSNVTPVIHEWIWTEDGSTSTLTARAYSSEASPLPQRIERYVSWLNNRLTFLEAKWSHDTPVIATTFGAGVMGSNMLEPGPKAGPVDLYVKSAAQGNVTHFGDASCAIPL